MRLNCLLVMLLTVGMFGQDRFGRVDRAWTFSGTITNASSIPIPDASITVTKINQVGTEEISWVSHGTTKKDGKYRFALAYPGRYSVKITAKGFQNLEFQGLTMLMDDPADSVLNFSLEVERTGAIPPK